MEPRFKRDKEGGNKPPTKKTMYLRLGYTANPRKQKGKQPPNKPKIKSECPGGRGNCRDCKGVNTTSPEALLKEQSGAKAIAPLFESAIPKRHCCGDGGEECCGEE